MPEPLRIEATLAGPICLPGEQFALDGLLAWAVVQRDELPFALTAAECVPIEIPIAREPGGRFHLASFADYEVDGYERQWTNRRFPLEQAQAMGDDRLRRIRLSAGATKSYRLPREARHLVDDRLTWWAIGEAAPIRELLGWIGYLGKKRNVGLGKVRRWSVAACDSWGEGFPVARDGLPLRALPPDWSGLREPKLAYGVLTYPYWDHAREELCAVPVSS